MNESSKIIRGEQAKMPLNAAIVGGGKACYNLLLILDEVRLKRLNMKILGVADMNPEAPGLLYAKKLGLFTTANFRDLYDLEGLNLIIELTGSTKVREKLIRTKPLHISSMDHRGARLLWDLIQIEVEKTELERERLRNEEKNREHIQAILDFLPYRIMVVTVNETYLRDLNLTRDKVLGKKCYEVRYGRDKPCTETGTSCFLKGRLEELKKIGRFSTMKEYKDKDGKTRFDVITISPIFNDNREIVQLLETSRDVTGRIKSLTGT
jgi:PAS domain-containing protein